MLKALFSFLVLFLFSRGANAGGWLAGPSGACWVNTDGTNSFYYCGNQESGCAGKNERANHSKKTYYHNDTETISGQSYACCGGDANTMGKWQLSQKKEEKKRVEFENGYCEYTEVTKPCGEVTDNAQECTFPTGCYDGYEIIKGTNGDKCVLKCPDNYARESIDSEKCIDCEITDSQGIDNNGVCVSCERGREFWDSDNKKCVPCDRRANVVTGNLCTPIKSVGTASKDIMKLCWQCRNVEHLRNCLKNAADVDKMSENAKKDCKIFM